MKKKYFMSYLNKYEFVDTIVEFYREEFGDPRDLLGLIEEVLIQLGYE